MSQRDYSRYAETWVRIIDTDGNTWQGWVQFVEYPDETDDGQWSLGFENMLLNGKRTPIEVLSPSDIKAIEITDTDWRTGYQKYQDTVKQVYGN